MGDNIVYIAAISLDLGEQSFAQDWRWWVTKVNETKVRTEIIVTSWLDNIVRAHSCSCVALILLSGLREFLLSVPTSVCILNVPSLSRAVSLTEARSSRWSVAPFPMTFAPNGLYCPQ
jgi:hypothetical protein